MVPLLGGIDLVIDTSNCDNAMTELRGVTVTTDQAWARGATAPVTLPSAPAPPAPPTYFPPTAEGGRPGRGPRRRFPRWIVGTVVLVVVAAAGVGGGWALRGATTPEQAPPSAFPSTPGTANLLTPAQAKQQACDGYATLGAQWSAGFTDWKAAVSAAGDGWTWSTPGVKEATAKFFPSQTQMVSQLRGLVAPNTPVDVASTVNDYAAAVLGFTATQGTNLSGADINAKVDAINGAADSVIKACGL